MAACTLVCNSSKKKKNKKKENLLLFIRTQPSTGRMSTFESLKEFAEQRLAAAVDEIFEYFEKTVTEYDEELDCYCRLLDIILQPQIILRRAGLFSIHRLTLIIRCNLNALLR